MIRRRSSIKGIGASIFYDSDDPELVLKSDGEHVAVRSAEPATLRDQGGSSSFPSTASGPYDTGDLITLLDTRGSAEGNGNRGKSTTRPETSSRVIPLYGNGTRKQPGGHQTGSASRESYLAEVSAAPEMDEPPPWDETEELVTIKRRSVSEVTSGAVSASPGIEAPGPGSSGTFEPEEPAGSKAGNDQPVGGGPANRAAPLGDLKTLTPEQEEQARKRLGEDAFPRMLQEIDGLYKRITASLSTRNELAQRAMDLLSEARDLLLLGNAGDFNLAERRVNEVRVILNQVEQTRRWGGSYGWGLFVYELVLFAGFVIALLFEQHIAEWISLMTGTYSVTNGVAELTRSMGEIFPPWNTMLWGGIGGVVGALYSLHWHVSELQDFDKQYSLWYVVQPLMGLILGGIIYLVIVAGLLAMIPGGSGAAQPTIATQWFPALVACLAGFRQKFTYELLDSIMKALGRQPSSARA